MRKICFILLLVFLGSSAQAQSFKIRGTVYDSSRNYPLEAVSVLSTSGRGTATNAEGIYEIEVTEKDSIWFSYLNKPTMKFPVAKINNAMQFDISLLVNIPVLKEVKIRPRNYKLDSIQNRMDYAKIFDYRKPGLRTTTPSPGSAAGFDLNELINIFRFNRNRSTASFQKRLLEEEREKFVSHRFSKALVKRITGLEGSELDSFMLVYRPSYAFAKLANDYDFNNYIKISFLRFQKGLAPDPFRRESQ